MTKIVGISFKDKGRIYNFSPNDIELKPNITVIVETERGIQFGRVETKITEIDEEKIKTPLKKVLRIATKEDYQKNKKNLNDAVKALQEARKIVKKYNLNMNIIYANYTFDRDQLLFRFIADSRVDFRDLVKDLASLYHTRIELRQVGVRDKAREIGGIGMCGKKLCCAQFNYDFDAVSINMAKNQNLSLNPTKINGICGRLLCCLKYEDETYKDCRKCLPQLGKLVETKKGKGKVVSLDILKKTYRVDIPEVGIVEVNCKGEIN